MGAWKEIIKPALNKVRAAYNPPLKEDWFQGTTVYCKCGNLIIRSNKLLPMYREITFLTGDAGKHVTGVCMTCFDQLQEDPQGREDYYLLDLVEWQDEEDAITDPDTKQKTSMFLESAARRGIL